MLAFYTTRSAIIYAWRCIGELCWGAQATGSVAWDGQGGGAGYDPARYA
jgi:hypothetical protein